MFPLKKKETPKENGKKNQTSILWRWITFRLFQPLGIIILSFDCDTFRIRAYDLLRYMRMVFLNIH